MRVTKRANKLIALFLLFSLIVTCFQGVVAEDLEDGGTASAEPSSVVTEIEDGDVGSNPEETVDLNVPQDDGTGEETGTGNDGEENTDLSEESSEPEDPNKDDVGDEDLNKDDPGDEEPNKDDGEEQVVAPGDDEGEENLDPEVKQPEDENDQDPDEEKENQVDESGEVDKPEEEPEPAQGMLRAAPPTRAVTLNWELQNYPSPSYSDNRVWIYGRNVTYEVDNGVVTGVVEIQVVPVRSDYYKFYGSDIRTMSQSNPNSSGSFPFAQYMDATVADSDGNILATSEDLFFYSPNPSTSPAKLEAGKTYTLTLRFKDIYAYYQDIGDNLSLVKISALTRHNYVNGKCDACYDEYPEDMYSHIGYRLASSIYNRPDHVYVYDAEHPETRLEVHATEKVYIDGQLVSDFVTTANHLRADNYGGQGYLNSPNAFLPNNNSDTYIEVTMWSHDKTLAPIKFKLYCDPETCELKTEVLAGKGSVQTIVLPEQGIVDYMDEVPIAWYGGEFVTTLDSYYFYDSHLSRNFIYDYWTGSPIPFSAPVVRRNADTGVFEISLVDRDQGVQQYCSIGLGTEHFTYYDYPILYYAMAVQLEKVEEGDPWGVPAEPLKIETFDVELSDYTEDTATVTVTGKLSRDLINREADEENLVQAYAESLSLSVGDKISKLYESDIDSDGSFTISLEDATLDANIVLRTQGGSSASAQGNSGGTAPGDNGQRPTLRRFITAGSENGSGLIGYKRSPILRVDGDTEGGTGEDIEYAYGYADGIYETLYVPLLQMPLSKVWTDSEGKTSNAITARHKDDVVVVDILADGEVVRTVELTSKTDPAWELVVKGLPEYTHYERGADPETITYKAKEKEIKGYSTQYGEEASSKYLILGEKVTEATFSGKYILLSESAKMALSVKDGEVVVVPFDPEDEYQKWSTEEKVFDYAFVWRSPSGSPVGQYKAVVVKNDKTGQYLGITTAGPVLYDSAEIADGPGLATYIYSGESDFGVIRTIAMYNSEANRFASYRDPAWSLYGFIPEEMMDSTMIIDPGADFPLFVMGYVQLFKSPWPFLALKWYDAKVSTAFVASLASSSTLADVNVYDESDGILYKVTNTPNTLVIEKSLEFEQSGQAKTVKEEVFYVTLFTDSGRTERAKGIDVQKISIVNGSSGKVLIEGIPSGTYYIGETDANGVLLEDGELSDGTSFVPQFDTTEIEIPEDGTEGVTFTFKNVITDPPKTADIVVNKQLVDQETGKDVVLTGQLTIFVALFSDADHLVRVSEIKEMVIDGTSSGTVTFEGMDEGIYYISETDANGTAISSGTIGSSTQYEASYTEGEKVTVTGENESEEITFKNVFAPEKPPIEPPVPPKAPSTGDPSVNYLNTYVVLMLISLGVVVNIVLRILKKKS